MGLTIGVVGSGFARSFIPLFQAHPLVEEVALAELNPDWRRETAQQFQIRRTYASLEGLCQSNVDAVAIFSQRHLHGPQVLTALRSGKHVYCAVPMASSLEEIAAIMEEVSRRRLIYMTGETSYYYPDTVYCRDHFMKGDFGEFVYGEAQYLHDMSHGFYDAFRRAGGEEWKRVAGFPPMYYPTHSVSMILSVTGARVEKIACLGYRDHHEDGIFRENGNLWANPYSNETALARTSDGGMCRFNEFRRVGWAGKNSVYLSLYGTLSSYEEHANSSVRTSIRWGDIEDLTDLLACEDYPVEEYSRNLHAALQHDFHKGLAKVHHARRLPDEFRGKPNGHFGAHQFLVDDFVKAVVSHQLPPNHAWKAAKYCVPGLIAHESALRGGEWRDIPDFGDPPTDWELLDPERKWDRL